MVAAIEMGYGHLRAALPLADLLDVPVTEVDRPPVARIDERRLWQAARSLYECASRGSRLPVVGPLLRRALDHVTAIAPLHHWLTEWLEDGVLAAAAWAGFQHLPNRGLYRIVEEMARI